MIRITPIYIAVVQRVAGVQLITHGSAELFIFEMQHPLFDLKRYVKAKFNRRLSNG